MLPVSRTYRNVLTLFMHSSRIPPFPGGMSNGTPETVWLGKHEFDFPQMHLGRLLQASAFRRGNCENMSSKKDFVSTRVEIVQGIWS